MKIYNKIIAIYMAVVGALAGGVLLFGDIEKPTEAEQQEYYNANGKYLQKLSDGSKEVNVYDGPSGKGYQTLTKTIENGKIITDAVGYGPEAARLTYQIIEDVPVKSANIASTTPAK